MLRFLRNTTPGTYFIYSAFVGVLIAAGATLIPGIELGFIRMLLILLSIDVITYIAMKAGWIRIPGQRGGAKR